MRRLTTLAATLAAALVLAACDESSAPVVETDAAADEGDQAEESEGEPQASDEPADDDPADDPDDGDPAEEEPEESEEAEEGAAPEAARAYFEAMATYQPSTMRQMLDHAAEGSPAYVFAAVHVAGVEALADEGGTSGVGEVAVTETGVRVCTDIDVGPDCTDMGELTVTDGKLATFTVDGTPIDDRLAAGGAAVTDGAITVTLLGAYHHIQGDVLFVALDLVNDGDEPVYPGIHNAEYVDDDGHRVPAVGAFGPYELGAGAAGSAVILVPVPSVSGTFQLVGFDEDDVPTHGWELPLTPID